MVLAKRGIGAPEVGEARKSTHSYTPAASFNRTGDPATMTDAKQYIPQAEWLIIRTHEGLTCSLALKLVEFEPNKAPIRTFAKPKVEYP